MPGNHLPGRRCVALTLVELLFVIGIIAIVTTFVMVAIGVVRQSAQETETKSKHNTLAAGLESYRKEFETGYPPSNTDSLLGSGPTSDGALSFVDLQLPKFPPGEVTTPPPGDDCKPGADPGAGQDELTQQWLHTPISGANSLVWALVGADFLGTPGFLDLNRNGSWFDEAHDRPGGLYEKSDDPQHRPVQRRYGPFVDLDREDIGSIMQNLPQTAPQDLPWFVDESFGSVHSFFLDGFGYPILYYRANVGAKYMTTFIDDQDGAHRTGVYDYAANVFHTGDGSDRDGLDLGAGPYHQLNQYATDGKEIAVDPDPGVTNLNDHYFDGSFAKFIWNRKITVRNEPVNKDSYLLISAGPDALWGTDDDITNFDTPGF